MVVVNVRLEGELERMLHLILKRGYAASKAEVMRMSLRETGEKLLKKEERLSEFMAADSNQDIWNDKKEDEVWDKY